MIKGKKIESETWYTLHDIVNKKLIPWATTYWAMKQIARNKNYQKVLKAIVKGKDKNTRYHFKGSNIINFNSKVESGKIRL